MSKVLGNLSEGLIFILSAPAGTGKTTLVRMLQEEFPCIAESISCTTRTPRPLEKQGKDYHFLTQKEFDERLLAGDFLEHAKVFGHYYGTSKSDVLKQRKQGKHVFLVIDTQGAMQLKGKIQGVFIFLSPPDVEELKKRLLQRRTESKASLEERLSWAQEEMKMVVNYDYHIINDNLGIAYEVLRSIVIAEEHRVYRLN